MNRSSAWRDSFGLHFLHKLCIVRQCYRQQLHRTLRLSTEQPLAIHPSPLKDLVRVDSMCPGNPSHRRPRLQRLFHNQPPLHRTATTARYRSRPYPIQLKLRFRHTIILKPAPPRVHPGQHHTLTLRRQALRGRDPEPIQSPPLIAETLITIRRVQGPR